MPATTDPQDNVTAFWSMVAPGYEAHPGNVPAHGTADHQRWVDLIDEELPGGAGDVLDLATGTGFLALILAALSFRVVAIDLSSEMLAEARRTAAQRTLHVDFRQADAVSPPFEPESFDGVTCRHLLWTLREPERALANWHRLLRPRGRVVAMDGFWFGSEGGQDDEEPEPFRRHYTRETRAVLPFMHLNRVEPIVDAFANAGFGAVSSRPLPELTNEATGTAVPYVIVATK